MEEESSTAAMRTVFRSSLALASLPSSPLLSPHSLTSPSHLVFDVYRAAEFDLYTRVSVSESTLRATSSSHPRALRSRGIEPPVDRTSRSVQPAASQLSCGSAQQTQQSHVPAYHGSRDAEQSARRSSIPRRWAHVRVSGIVASSCSRHRRVSPSRCARCHHVCV